jgi:hypothetical protein
MDNINDAAQELQRVFAEKIITIKRFPQSARHAKRPRRGTFRATPEQGLRHPRSKVILPQAGDLG